MLLSSNTACSDNGPLRSYWLGVLVVIATTCDVIVAQPQEAPLRYRVRENVRVGTRIGNVINDSGLRRQHSSAVLRQLRFSFLTRPSLPVDIGYTDGLIVTTGDVDREAMASCRHQARCDVTVDVTVQPVTYFRIIKVVLEVIDENDNPPSFGESSSHATLSISSHLARLVTLLHRVK